jgi:hypothetical protein
MAATGCSASAEPRTSPHHSCTSRALEFGLGQNTMTAPALNLILFVQLALGHPHSTAESLNRGNNSGRCSATLARFEARQIQIILSQKVFERVVGHFPVLAGDEQDFLGSFSSSVFASINAHGSAGNRVPSPAILLSSTRSRWCRPGCSFVPSLCQTKNGNVIPWRRILCLSLLETRLRQLFQIALQRRRLASSRLTAALQRDLYCLHS